MRARLGLGPVFYFEWLVASRRWQFYALRALFVAVVFAALAIVWLAHPQSPGAAPAVGRRTLANVGEQFFYALVGTQLTLILLAAPAATAGAICLDRARGALTHLLVTDLSNAEIILGKLAARLLPVLGMVLAGLPVLAVSILLGGVDPEAVLAAFLVSLGVAVLGCALALTLSLWGQKPYEVLLATYLIWILFLLARPLWSWLSWAWSLGPAPAWLELANPYWLAFAPYLRPGTTGYAEPCQFLAAALALSAALMVLAVARVRAVAARQAGRVEPAPRPGRLPDPARRRWPGPSLDHNPVLWREWHRQRPSRWVRFVWGIYGLLAGGATLLAIWFHCLSGQRGEFASFVNAFQVSVGLLLLSIAAVTTLGEERACGSLEVLLTTPLTTGSIVWGKWWGAYRTVPRLAFLPALLVCALALQNERWLLALCVVSLIFAYGALVTSLGLALATWIPRQGRAIGCSVAVYVGLTVATFPLVFLVFRTTGADAAGMAIVSPFYGAGLLTSRLENQRGGLPTEYLAWGFLWVFLYLAAALVLFVVTLATFNSCLGRMPERMPSSPPRRGRTEPPAPLPVQAS